MTTSKAVLEWLEANIGNAIEFNNGSDVQDMDLVNYVSQKFFGTAMFVGIGTAQEIWNLSFPDGWSKVPASEGAQPGDFFVMSGEQAGNSSGHTGLIAEDGIQVYDENYAGRKYVSKHGLTGGFIGFIRPPYEDEPTPEGDEEMAQALLVYNSFIYYMVGTDIKKLTTADAAELIKKVYKAQYGKGINAFSLTDEEAKGLGIE